MNYKLNFALMLVVFSVVTYNVCMAYQEMQDVSLSGQFQKIGILDTAKATENVVASAQ